MATIAFIPVRCGSKSIPFKNIKDFCGKPLIYWNLKALQDCTKVDKIYVATDCSEIEQVAKSFGFSKVEVYRRQVENATDTASTESVMLEFLEWKAVQFQEEDIFILVQATSPFTSTRDFTEALQLFQKDALDSLLTCVRTKRFFWNKEGTPINYDYRSRPRRQDFPGMLMENGAFYVSTIQAIMVSKNRLSGKIGIYEMSEDTAIELDEESDWLIAEQIMKANRSYSI
ncbi:acylneuraminate cytidylyltransferase family protein [Rhodocytophaga rosea]|uniref:Acylneuraminate cytidylyltransferase family protein n=1 Tax=Rhodocytophaga rosea TaxID=2704465 RepID=A0A6C0GNZ8_9BACT|nr:acylneuraminate cytidylyltransferase family protein [Rhodocytophaga rosea]QHT69574.1 acylneuraminate cytidylyltransferase family protein [Rhodocytophaga rosea]